MCTEQFVVQAHRAREDRKIAKLLAKWRAMGPAVRVLNYCSFSLKMCLHQLEETSVIHSVAGVFKPLVCNPPLRTACSFSVSYCLHL